MKVKPIRFIFIIVVVGVLICLYFSRNNYEKDKAAIIVVMEKQELSWNEGDMEAYMQGYWNSDKLRFMGQNGITYGWKQQLENYNKGYPNKDVMGKLTFDYISFDKMGNKNMFVVGMWNVERKDESLNGYFSLVWEKIEGEWKIIFDHTP